MLKILPTYIVSDVLSSRTPTIHGFSKRELGDMRTEAARGRFCNQLGLKKYIIMVKQVHGTEIYEPKNNLETDVQADSIVLTRSSGLASNAAIGVIVADCVPLLLADTDGIAIAAVHAGWKGTLSGIVTKVIDRMCEAGAHRERIIVSIGPRIGRCCYTIPKVRMELFQNSFGGDPRVCYSTHGEYYLDLGFVNHMQLIQSGIMVNNIDARISCTSCQRDGFYSYRKDSKETFGEHMGLIAFTSES